MKQKNLTLGYNLLNVGQVDNNKLGNIAVTVIYRPVASVGKSGKLKQLGNRHHSDLIGMSLHICFHYFFLFVLEAISRLANIPNQDQSGAKSKGFINSAVSSSYITLYMKVIAGYLRFVNRAALSM